MTLPGEKRGGSKGEDYKARGKKNIHGNRDYGPCVSTACFQDLFHRKVPKKPEDGIEEANETVRSLPTAEDEWLVTQKKKEVTFSA